MNTRCPRLLHLAAACFFVFGGPQCWAVSAPDCGVFSKNENAVPRGTQLWYLGPRLIYEVPGGISVTPGLSGPAFPFQRPEERIVAVFDDHDLSAVLVVTRQPRGFALYRWGYADPAHLALGLVFSKPLQFVVDGKQTYSPVVDAIFDSGKLYLLTNFNFITLALPDIESGAYSPVKTEALPFCQLSKGTCSRGVGVYKANSRLYVPRMHSATGTNVDLNLMLDLSGATPSWSLGTPWATYLAGASYFNILNMHSTVVNGGDRLVTGAQVSDGGFVWSRQFGSGLVRLNDYPIAAATLDVAAFPRGTVLISFQNSGTFAFRGGSLNCRLFKTAKSLVAAASGNTVHVTAIDSSGSVYETYVEN